MNNELIVLRDARIFDGVSAEILEGGNVVVEGDRIREVTSSPVKLRNARSIDCRGHFLMPGLIDAHFHAYSPSFDVAASNRMPATLLAQHARVIVEGALLRGFTTVRDAGGGDFGLWAAIEQGLVRGPRFFYSGRAITQTGGHGDMRPADSVEPCRCGSDHRMTCIADGVDAVRQAAREELRKGATQIKIFVSGGIASPTDPIWMPQFSDAEVRVAVEEAARRRTYVMAHCHTDDGARRCAELGVRSIEHGTDISAETARVLAEKNVFVVPTLTVMDVLRRNGEHLALPPAGREKLRGVYEQMAASIKNCVEAGVRLGLGADLMDSRFHPLQGWELSLRGEISAPLEVLRSATSVNAELLQMRDLLGCVKPGAYADLIVIAGDPTRDLTVFRDQRNLQLVMKGGEIMSERLD
ncbi:MAG TPA: amidohydrolase family protein [Steroidobacter sp.]